jgi:hypothetical protein
LGLLPKIPKTPSPTPKTTKLVKREKKVAQQPNQHLGKKRKLFNKLKVAEINLF